MRVRVRGALFLVALLCATSATAAPSEGEPAAEGPAAKTKATGPIPDVELGIVGDAPDADALGEQVLSWFRKDTNRTHLTRLKKLDASTALAPSPTAGVRVWMFLPTVAIARLLFAIQERPGDSPRFLVDDLELDSGLDEVGREHLAQVVYLSASALWAGNAESTQREVEERLAHSWRTAEPAAPPPPAPPRQAAPAHRPVARTRATIGFEYLLRAHGEEGIAHALGVDWEQPLLHTTVDVLTALHVDFVLPRSAENRGLHLDLVGAEARLGILATGRLSKRFSVLAEAGPGIEAVHYTPTFGDGTVQAVDGRLNFRPIAYGTLGIRFSAQSIQITLAALVAFALERTHYDVTSLGQSQELLVPARVQPGFSAGVSW
jgi:hypothetical protein